MIRRGVNNRIQSTDTIFHHIVEDCQIVKLLCNVVELTAPLSLDILDQAVEKDMAKVFSKRFYIN